MCRPKKRMSGSMVPDPDFFRDVLFSLFGLKQKGSFAIFLLLLDRIARQEVRVQLALLLAPIFNP